MKLLQFGAGNIGRSFIGQLFARSGCEVVFADIDEGLIAALNSERRYRVIVKRNEAPDETIWVEKVRGVNAADSDAVASELATADIVATSVGKGALTHVYPVIADGLLKRDATGKTDPLEIIIAENVRSGAQLFREGLAANLPSGYPLNERVGLVETSIGKMVPIMTDEDRAADPLWVFAEAYNTLIVDRNGFRGSVPNLAGIEAVANIDAYVDRKLFVHNLGHAATAYLGYARNPHYTYVWEPLAERDLLQHVSSAMREAAAALNREYTRDLSMRELEEHIDDLLRRFANRALGDTIYRVGRDLYRKLGREDRLIGACLLAARHELPFPSIARAVRAAAGFKATDEHGVMFPNDRRFHERETPKGLEHILREVCGLDPQEPFDVEVTAVLRQA